MQADVGAAVVAEASAMASSPAIEAEVAAANIAVMGQWDLASMVIATALRGPEAEQEFEEVLLPTLLEHSNSRNAKWELTRLVQTLADNQVTLRCNFSRGLGRFCMHAADFLGRCRCELWQALTANLRLLEGVLLVCVAHPEDRALLCQTAHRLLHSRPPGIPRSATSRIEAAIMALSEEDVRALYAPTSPSSTRPQAASSSDFHVENSLQKFAGSLRPSPETERRRQLVFEAFDAVIYQRFGVHGRPFGSMVNGLQIGSSDIDISVLLSPEDQVRLLNQAREQADREAADAAGAGTGGAGDPRTAAGWGFLTSHNTQKAASIAATRALADALREHGLNVVEVIEAARVPIVKCKHVFREAETETSSAVGESEFEVDISFCNELASHNSRLLRAYAEFDPRAQSLCLLVKMWAKRRKINSPFDGTLSSYSYSLMVIHYLQLVGILPNLQRPHADVLAFLGLEAPGERRCGCNDVWFLDPAEAIGGACSSGSADGGTGAAVVEGAGPRPPPPELWLGGKRPKMGLYELIYGFFRYFAIEFNSYADVVSIRLPSKTSKLEHFAQVGYAAPGEEDEEKPVEEPSPLEGNDIATPETTPLLRPSSEPRKPDELDLDGMLLEGDEEGDGGDDEDEEEDEPSQLVSAHFDPDGADAEGDGSDCAGDEVVLTGALLSSPFAEFAAGGAQESAVSSEAQKDLAVVADQATSAVTAGEKPVVAASVASSKRLSSSFVDWFVGSVRSFNEEKGFGFIECEATFARFSRDVFLHQHQYLSSGVIVGDCVRFEVELNGKGQPQARRVEKAAHTEQSSAPVAATPSENTLSEADGGTAAFAPPSGVACAQASPKLSPDISPFAGPMFLGSFSVPRSRIGERTCLCIDDPFERNRTLGTSFLGQELLAHELRRGLSILKKGGDKIMDLFKENKSVPAKRSPLMVREYSPIPVQTVSSDAMGEMHVSVQVERPVKKELVGKIIGSKGTNIRRFVEETQLEECRVNESKTPSTLVMRGKPDVVRQAMLRVDKLLSTAKKSPDRAAYAQGTRSRSEVAAERLAYQRGPVPFSGVRDSVAKATAKSTPTKGGTVFSPNLEAALGFSSKGSLAGSGDASSRVKGAGSGDACDGKGGPRGGGLIEFPKGGLPGYGGSSAFRQLDAEAVAALRPSSPLTLSTDGKVLSTMSNSPLLSTERGAARAGGDSGTWSQAATSLELAESLEASAASESRKKDKGKTRAASPSSVAGRQGHEHGHGKTSNEHSHTGSGDADDWQADEELFGRYIQRQSRRRESPGTKGKFRDLSILEAEFNANRACSGVGASTSASSSSRVLSGRGSGAQDSGKSEGSGTHQKVVVEGSGSKSSSPALSKASTAAVPRDSTKVSKRGGADCSDRDWEEKASDRDAKAPGLSPHLAAQVAPPLVLSRGPPAGKEFLSAEEVEATLLQRATNAMAGRAADNTDVCDDKKKAKKGMNKICGNAVPTPSALQTFALQQWQ